MKFKLIETFYYISGFGMEHIKFPSLEALETYKQEFIKQVGNFDEERMSIVKVDVSLPIKDKED